VEGSHAHEGAARDVENIIIKQFLGQVSRITKKHRLEMRSSARAPTKATSLAKCAAGGKQKSRRRRTHAAGCFIYGTALWFNLRQSRSPSFAAQKKIRVGIQSFASASAVATFARRQPFDVHILRGDWFEEVSPKWVNQQALLFDEGCSSGNLGFGKNLQVTAAGAVLCAARAPSFDSGNIMSAAVGSFARFDFHRHGWDFESHSVQVIIHARRCHAVFVFVLNAETDT
jgi:hypothetical protein